MKNELLEWYVASVMPPVVENINGKYQYQGWRPCMEWCIKIFGGGIGDTAYGPGWRFVGEGVFEFREEQDYIMFLLKWA
jgi:hypothetical protein